MAVWQLQEAKQRLSEVVRRALEDEPQVISRHGHNAVVVVAADEFEKLGRGPKDFKAHLCSAPDVGRLGIRRDRRPARRVHL
jgi:prevent-host-death family protein